VVSGKAALMAIWIALEAVHNVDQDVFDAHGCRKFGSCTESQILPLMYFWQPISPRKTSTFALRSDAQGLA